MAGAQALYPNIRNGGVFNGNQSIISNVVGTGLNRAEANHRAAQVAQGNPNQIVLVVGPGQKHRVGSGQSSRLVDGPYLVVLGGTSGAGSNPANPNQPNPQGGSGQSAANSALTNANVATTGGGADINRAGTSARGVGVDVRSEFLGISDYSPDTQVGPQFAIYSENVDGIEARGALSKRAGLIPVRPRREDTPNNVGGSPIPAVSTGLQGRSINVLPPTFYENGQVYMVLGYDNSSDLGRGAAAVAQLRGLPVDINYNGQRDISRVKATVSVLSTTSGNVQLQISLPELFRRDLGDVNGTLASVARLVVISNTVQSGDDGFVLDRDLQDIPGGRSGGNAKYVSEYVSWDGNNITVTDTEAYPASTEVYYTVIFLNDREESLPTLVPVGVS